MAIFEYRFDFAEIMVSLTLRRQNFIYVKSKPYAKIIQHRNKGAQMG